MTEPIVLSTATADQTRAVGEAVGELLGPGDLVSLTGDLGAGKTTFVQGAARALGVSQPVLSPTFTLVREYRGRVPVVHVDVYRLERIQDVLDLGFDEFVDSGGVVFVEWGDAVASILPPGHLLVELTLPDATEARLVAVTPVGPPWAARAAPLAEALSRWRAG